MNLLADVGVPSSGAIAAGAGIVLLIAIAAVSYIAFRIFRKTLKMAFRFALLASILVALLGGSLGLWWIGRSSPGPKPPQQRNR